MTRPATADPSPPDRADRVDGVDRVDLGAGVVAGFTGRSAHPHDAPEPLVGVAGNIAHRRPHEPSLLAATRAGVAQDLGVAPGELHLMQQVHGADVAVITAATRAGAESRAVDALVTAEPGRALLVQVADCVPVLFASDAGPVGVAHAGRRGVELGVIAATVAALSDLGASPESLSVAVGPAIGGCCYEVPEAMRDEVGAVVPSAVSETTWGTPALDLPGAVLVQLAELGIDRVLPTPGCTRCDPGERWFSHRADAATGRQAGVIVRHTERDHRSAS